MLIIEDSIKMDLYGKKANKLGISNYMITGRRSDDGLNVIKMMKKCETKEEFRKKVMLSLMDERNTDYLHMSLISGLFFGCFNLYNYVNILPRVRKEIVRTNPNKEDTFSFVRNNLDKISSYFKEKYGIDEDSVVRIISSMFTVTNNKSEQTLMYNNDIVMDMNMILMGRALSNDVLSFDEAIDTFLKENGELYKHRS